jgi:hypothetical protein
MIFPMAVHLIRLCAKVIGFAVVCFAASERMWQQLSVPDAISCSLPGGQIIITVKDADWVYLPYS